MTKQTNIKISIILPVYNVEWYLEECLNSLLCQTLQEIEIICVNDGSSDKSLAILERYAVLDPRVHVRSQKNQGVSIARNRGLEEASGEYVYFMDSDDYLVGKDALATMYEHMKKDDLDVLSFNYKTIGFQENEYRLKIREDVVMEGKEFFYEPAHSTVMIWIRLLKRNYLKQIDFKFIPYIAAEDDEAIPKWYYSAKRVKHIADILLCYRLREGSITNLNFSQKRIDGLIATSKAFFLNSKSESEKKLKMILFQRGVDYLFLAYKDMYYGKDIVPSKKQYTIMLKEVGFNSIESLLLQNEAIFIKYRVIDQKNKFFRPKVYLMRKIRILYFTYIYFA